MSQKHQQATYCNYTSRYHYGSYYKVNITQEELDRMREARSIAFDRWNWETGKREDREEFESLDREIKFAEEHFEIVKLVGSATGY